jgi:L-aspartate oxidase
VVHSKDTTGGEVEATLAATVRGMTGVSIFERVFAVDLITDGGRCVGVLAVLNGRLTAFLAPVVILAAGGMGQLYSITTNPPISTGDGLAMAFRAGATLTDIEFVQFHPTALHISVSPRFLISEAVRGEGAYLVDKNGDRFMVGRHPMAELAPRDVVVRGEYAAMRATGEDHVYLDCRHLGLEYFEDRFPAIYDELVSYGLDVARQLIPVSPAAHYMSGGIKVDLDGRTGIDGFFACGEVACTGVHGANRLASNSLLEGLVFSRRAAKAAATYIKRHGDIPAPDLKSITTDTGGTLSDARAAMADFRDAMMADAGISRSAAGLDKMLSFIKANAGYLAPTGPWADDYELSNMLLVGWLIATAASARQESRGSHWREDFPEENDAVWRRHIAMQRGENEWVKLKII